MKEKIKALTMELLNLEMSNAELKDRLIQNGDEDWLKEHYKWVKLNKLNCLKEERKDNE